MRSPILKNKADLALRDKWYDKLKKDGFVDIENNSLPEPDLKACDVIRFNNVTPEEYEAKTKYYADARALLHVYKFESKLERRIWELHSEGMSLREIEAEIKNKYKKDTINLIIHRIRTNWTS